MSLRPTLEHPLAGAWSRPGGPWDVANLDAVLSQRELPPELAAVVDGSRRVGSQELTAAIASVAGGLRSAGVGRGDVVAWQRPNGHETLVLCRACWRIGAVAAPLHHQAGAVEIERMVAALDPKLVLGPGPPPAGGEPITTSAAAGADLALVQFTSGSTGAPKAVLQTHRSLAYKARTMVEVHGLGPGDVVLMPSPVAHVSGLLNGVLLPGAAPMTVVWMDKWDPERGLRLIEEERVTFMIGPPTLFTGLMELPDFSPAKVASMRVISSGAMGVRPEFVAAASEVFGAQVKRSYGSTEAPTVTSCVVGDPLDKACNTDGHAIGAAEVVVVDRTTGAPLPPGETGEVRVRGPELFAGYAVAEQTDAAMADGWLLTGDLGVLDADGWLQIVGRTKDLIIRSGENISPAEVEATLEAHPSIRQAVAVGYPDEKVGERVAAFVISDEPVDVAWARAWFETQGVARFKTPERVIRVDEVPLLGVGKPDRAALRAQAARDEAGSWTSH